MRLARVAHRPGANAETPQALPAGTSRPSPRLVAGSCPRPPLSPSRQPCRRRPGVARPPSGRSVSGAVGRLSGTPRDRPPAGPARRARVAGAARRRPRPNGAAPRPGRRPARPAGRRRHRCPRAGATPSAFAVTSSSSACPVLVGLLGQVQLTGEGVDVGLGHLQLLRPDRRPGVGGEVGCPHLIRPEHRLQDQHVLPRAQHRQPLPVAHRDLHDGDPPGGHQGVSQQRVRLAVLGGGFGEVALRQADRVDRSAVDEPDQLHGATGRDPDPGEILIGEHDLPGRPGWCNSWRSPRRGLPLRLPRRPFGTAPGCRRRPAPDGRSGRAPLLPRPAGPGSTPGRS